MGHNIIRYEIKVYGVVQGVGFRPFVYLLATKLGLNGWVSNVGSFVLIDIEGYQDALVEFIYELEHNPPSVSKINSIEIDTQKPEGTVGFSIKYSSQNRTQNIYVPPDICICKDCAGELYDKSNRRYLYPFINCTNCGPRFTIIKDTPYDRENTTMHSFGMCEKCMAEYKNITDRRYHAQPISCYDCGPSLSLVDKNKNTAQCDDIIAYTRQLILEGKIIALKGLGGYHLICDANNKNAVLTLRQRKCRDHKPFAIMVKDSHAAVSICDINSSEKELLESTASPIVLLKRKPGCTLPDQIAPNNNYLGVMLAYTPIHMMLFEHPDGLQNIDALVVTSGNKVNEPIYYHNNDAISNLHDIADYFITNNRDIFTRTDDSVTRVFNNKEYIIRRSRGYVPSPITCNVFKRSTLPSVIAVGAELKNTFCVNRKNEFYISHHIGDLENLESLHSFEHGVEYFKKMFNLSPDIVAYDPHPDYLSTKFALELDMPNKVAVQHHHAHIVSCMAENNITDDVIGVTFDGTGYGDDHNIWGGEFLVASYASFTRFGHLEYVKMPGGSSAIKEPWRMAVAYLYSMYGTQLTDNLHTHGGLLISDKNILHEISPDKIKAVIQMQHADINCPLTSSIGRLFDAVSALLGIRDRINYEGQAAIELEHACSPIYHGQYSFQLSIGGDTFSICTNDIIYGIIEDIAKGLEVGIISRKFHQTVADIVLKACQNIRKTTSINKVALSGGVFQNITLLSLSVAMLEQVGFKVYTHSKVPTNDAGISLGQCLAGIAQARCEI